MWPSLHAILACMYRSRSPCIHNIWSNQNYSYICVKEVCWVFGCNFNAKWSVVRWGRKRVGSHCYQIAGNLLAKHYEWLWKYFQIIYNFWRMINLPMYRWKVYVKWWGMVFFIIWSIEVQGQQIPWFVGNVHYKRQGQVGTRQSRCYNFDILMIERDPNLGL